jgi:type I restriction enzyme M protein
LDLNWITNFIWGIADDALRDLYVRGKYRDVILPMMVLRRLDAVLEPTKAAVLSMKDNLDKAGITNQDAALRQAAGQAFYNTSRFNLRDLRNRASQSQLKADFEAFLDGFSPNVQEILCQTAPKRSPHRRPKGTPFSVGRASARSHAQRSVRALSGPLLVD